jgi:hypothetical protein
LARFSRSPIIPFCPAPSLPPRRAGQIPSLFPSFCAGDNQARRGYSEHVGTELVANKEFTMNPLDIHTITALDRQADHVRAVEATSTRPLAQPPAFGAARRLPLPGWAVLGLAVVFMAWGVLAR